MSEARLVACREKAFGILAIVFVAGLATGVLGVRAYDHQAEAPVTQSPLQQQTAVAIERLNRDLDLSPKQADRLKVILDDHIMMEADLLAQMRQLQQQGREEIMQVLDEGQKTKFTVMLQTVSAGP